MFGLKWGFGSAFVYALGQLALGLPEVLTWGLRRYAYRYDYV